MSGVCSEEVCPGECPMNYVKESMSGVCLILYVMIFQEGVFPGVYPIMYILWYVQRIMSWVCADEKFQVNVIV